MLIKEFYENHEIFITGGTGFVGKALIEKLLRSCPGVRKLFVLIRAKKGKKCEDRLRQVLESKFFNRLRKEQPNALEKVVAINGDCSELGLGISDADLERLMNVTLIFHSAASVRFDDALRDSILLNTRGTHELVKIAETMKHLKMFVHISTTYSNPDKHIVEEQIYPPYADWRTSIKLAENYSTETLNIFNLKYGDSQPNTYTFTKSMAEQIINDYKDKLPMLIFRPSIVISAVQDPVPGWVDNFNGPIGMLIACGIGILRTNYAEPNLICDFVPVDVVVRGLLTACYKNTIERSSLNGKGELKVINAATGGKIFPVTIKEIADVGRAVVLKNPLEKTLWVPSGGITPYRFWSYTRFMLLQVFPAILLDCVLRSMGKKPLLLKLQRRIYAAIIGLHLFMTTAWEFKNANYLELDDYVPEAEKDDFAVQQYFNLDLEAFLKDSLRGAKEYLLNEPPESSSAARMRLRIFLLLDTIIKMGIWFLIGRYLLRYINQKLSMF